MDLFGIDDQKVHDEVIAKTFTGINDSFVFVFAWS